MVGAVVQDLGEDDTERDVVDLLVPRIGDHHPLLRIVRSGEELFPEDRAGLSDRLERLEVGWLIRRPAPRGPSSGQQELVEALGRDDVLKGCQNAAEGTWRGRGELLRRERATRLQQAQRRPGIVAERIGQRVLHVRVPRLRYVAAAAGLEDTPGGGGMACQAVGGTNRAPHELAAAVRAAPAEPALGARPTERALERADHRVEGIAGQVAIAAFAAGPELQQATSS